MDPNDDPIVDVIHEIRKELNNIKNNDNNDETNDENVNFGNDGDGDNEGEGDDQVQTGYDLCDRIYIGYETSPVHHQNLTIDQCLKIVSDQQVDYVVHHIAHFDENVASASASDGDYGNIGLDERPMAQRHNIESTELLFRTTDWSNRVVGKINSRAFQLLSQLQQERQNEKNSQRHKQIQRAKAVIEREIAWANHLSLPAVVLPCPDEYNLVTFANILIKNCNSFCAYWIRVPVHKWHIWDQLRRLCEGTEAVKSLLPMVELTVFDEDHNNQSNQNNGGDNDDAMMFWRRWFGEILKVCILPLDAMQQGAPGLCRVHFTSHGPNQYISQFIKRAFRHDVQIVLSGMPPDSMNGGLRPYVDAIHELYDTCELLTEVEAFEKPYRDYLQVPLQPLHHNLESQTYEVFEKDPVKYALYQQAIYQALVEQFNELECVVIMVVGAGRGPLVKATIRAARQANKRVKIYAVEKNPNALVTLHHFKNTIWKFMDVHIIESDMRVWQPEELADILVSELLGSFGDNELSPECLDGAQRLMKPDTGISIPSSYRSYLSPLMSSRMYHEVSSLRPHKSRKSFETAYVVNVFNGVPLCEPQECFSFEHPTRETVIDNSRFSVLDFELPQCSLSNGAENSSSSNSTDTQMTIHGLIGYFECTLYKDVIMSILPRSFSSGMFSWFPILFPVSTPISVRGGSKIQVHMYRCVDKTKVWYEWTIRDLTSNQTVNMHNVNGRSYSIAL